MFPSPVGRAFDAASRAVASEEAASAATPNSTRWEGAGERVEALFPARGPPPDGARFSPSALARERRAQAANSPGQCTEEPLGDAAATQQSAAEPRRRECAGRAPGRARAGRSSRAGCRRGPRALPPPSPGRASRPGERRTLRLPTGRRHLPRQRARPRPVPPGSRTRHRSRHRHRRTTPTAARWCRRWRRAPARGGPRDRAR